MEDNVFGNPISVEAVAVEGEAEPEDTDDRNAFALQIVEGLADESQIRRFGARSELDLRNDGSKYQQALLHLKTMKARFGNGVSTLCLVYNATGGAIRFVAGHDWWGHVYGDSHYPREVANGQWGAFFHVKRTGTPDGSNAAVVYRGRNAAGEEVDYLLAWDNPWLYWRYNNKAYAEIREAGYFDRIDWKLIERCMQRVQLQHRATGRGCAADARTTRDTTATFEAILTLE
ncbi:23 kDa jasmonate-induced protein-like [Canna indica]|uniref:23 kDa jasmonate-induced protein-like n=1 Tax=Canna indica TaxID=4628 RepID=A0AAQ3QPI2_9LILI|nr:23 kDa jasmonate-induced protein-like [Canna indica]